MWNIRALVSILCLTSILCSAVEQNQRSGGGTSRAVLAAGCFWCVEAVFERIPGVRSVVSGHASGSSSESPQEADEDEEKGPAEAVQIEYDSSIVSFGKLLQVFWESHDPTTLNRQGPDVGEQYRSVIFYEEPGHRELAERSKIEAQKLFRDRIVTEIRRLKEFREAKSNHQDYYTKNPDAPYCKFIIRPKLKKLRLE